VKIATSTSSQPAAGTGTLFVGNTGTALIVGPFAFGATIYITITPYATVDGSQAAGPAAFVQKTIDGSSISTGYNTQGSILPIPFGASLFTGSWGGIGTGQMFVAFSWASQTLRKPDGSTLTLPAPPAALSLVTGDLGQVAGGTRGATTLFVRRGLVKDGHVCAVSAEPAGFVVNVNNLLTVAAPTNPGGYDGWCVLIGTVTNQEFLQDGTGGPAFPIPFGTAYTEPASHFSTAPSQYTAAWLSAVVYADLNPSITAYFYPFFDIALGFARFAPFNIAAVDTAPSMVDANKAWSDGRIALSNAGMTVAIGAGGGSGSPTTGGSRLT